MLFRSAFAEFRDADDCAEQCAQLLDNSDRLRALRTASGAYYESFVAPPVQMLRALEAAFA